MLGEQDVRIYKTALKIKVSILTFKLSYKQLALKLYIS